MISQTYFIYRILYINIYKELFDPMIRPITHYGPSLIEFGHAQ